MRRFRSVSFREAFRCDGLSTLSRGLRCGRMPLIGRGCAAFAWRRARVPLPNRDRCDCLFRSGGAFLRSVVALGLARLSDKLGSTEGAWQIRCRLFVRAFGLGLGLRHCGPCESRFGGGARISVLEGCGHLAFLLKRSSPSAAGCRLSDRAARRRTLAGLSRRSP